MANPFENDPGRAAQYRIRSLRRRKARALLASPHEKYAQMGQRLMEELEQEDALAQRQAERAFDETLRMYGIQREAERDEADAARHAELLDFQREKEQHDVEREARMLEQQAAEAAAMQGFRREQLGLQRAQLGQNAAEARAMQEFRQAQLTQQAAEADERLAAPDSPEHPEPPMRSGMFTGHASPGPASAPDDIIPGTRISGPSDAGQRAKLFDSATNIANLNRAYRLFRDNPGAYGGGNAWLGAASGIPLVGPQAKSLAGRLMNSETRKVRTAVEEVVSSILRERAGASQTEHEFLRQQFLPNEIDSSEQVDEKLRNLLQSEITRYKGLGGADELTLPASPSDKPNVDDLVRKYLGPKGDR